LLGSVGRKGIVLLIIPIFILTIGAVAPEAPQLLSPSDNSAIKDTTPTFEWGTVTDASTYILQYKKITQTWETGEQRILIGNTNTSYTVFSPLEKSEYEWRVKCINSKDIESGWSDIWSFTIDKTPPIMPSIGMGWSPQNGSIVGDNTPKFEWPSATDSSSGVEKYTFQYALDNTFSEATTITDLFVTYYTPVVSLENDTYFWRVKASDKAGNESEFSESLIVIINVPGQNTVLVIVKSTTRDEIAGASVKLGTYSMSTNSEGRAVFENVPNGTYSLTVTKEDYTSYSDVYDITGNTTIPVTLILKVEVLEKDLEVFNIQYSPEDPKEGEIVSIMAQVRNNSLGDKDVKTRLLVDYNTIEYQIIPIPSGDTKSVVFTWIAVGGDHKLGIHALELPGESDKSNNAQYVDVTVVKLPIGEADALFQKANTYYYNGEFAKAKQYYNLAKELYKQIPNQERIDQCDLMMANCNKYLEAMSLINQAEDAFEAEDCSTAIKLYNQAISIYEELKDTSRMEEAKKRLEEIEEACAPPPPTTTTHPPITTPSSQSNTLLYLGLFAAAIICILAVYQITKRKPEKVVKEKPIEKKPKEKPPTEEISPKLQKLLNEKQEWRERLDYLKNNKNELIKKGAMTEKIYQDRYDEIMDQLVDIEDRIIQEKMKGGKK